MNVRRIGTVNAIALTAMLLLPAGAAADTYKRQPGIRIAGYTFDISVSDANNEVAVRNTVELQVVAAGVTTVDLDLCNFVAAPRSPLMADGFRDPCAEPSGGRGATPTVAVGGRGMTVTEVTADGQPLKFQHTGDRVHVTLPRAFQPGERYAFTVAYHGVPATGLLIANNKYGDRGFFSDDWPNKARNYLAVVDHPSMKAPVVMKITAPRHYQVISNGRMIEESDLAGGLRRTVWKESAPICTWLIAVGIAPFAVDHFGDYQGIPLSSWVYPQEREVSYKAFAGFTRSILEFYSDRVGPYSYEKLAHVEANGVGGGMELASSIFYGYGAAGPGRQLIAHETAHQWFGDSATEADWDDVWLSEGFATYFALLYQEFKDGRDAFIEGVKRSKDQAVRYALANPDSTIVHKNLADISKVIANNAQIYQGGAQVLHNIRGVIGTETFWSGIRLYYRRFHDSNATTADLRRAMEEACQGAGDKCPAEGRDLAWLFQQLLNRGGALQLKGSWRYDAAAKQVEVTVDQTQASGVYQMPIEVAIAPGGDAPPAVHVMRLTRQHEVFTFPSAAEPVSVSLDPNAWVMMQASFEKK